MNRHFHVTDGIGSGTSTGRCIILRLSAWKLLTLVHNRVEKPQYARSQVDLRGHFQGSTDLALLVPRVT